MSLVYESIPLILQEPEKPFLARAHTVFVSSHPLPAAPPVTYVDRVFMFLFVRFYLLLYTPV